MSESLPEAQLTERMDAPWERLANDDRQSRARVWATQELAGVLVSQELGADVSRDDDFSAQVDRLYDGLRNRLTRQDLIAMVIESLSVVADKVAGMELDRLRGELDVLDESSPRRRTKLLNGDPL